MDRGTGESMKHNAYQDYDIFDINSQDIVLIIDWQDATDTDVGDMRGVS